MFEIGRWMDNQYLVIEKHRGRRWTVYITLDRISENVFVIKTPSQTSTAYSPERFEEKAKAWIKLGHCDGIVTAFMLKNFDDAPHLFIEYVAGPSLADILRSRPGKPLPLDQTTALMKEIIIAMKSLHSATFRVGGLIHGNLNPHNILTASGNIKITDVGISGAFDMPGGMMNADLFLKDMPCIAPEQIERPDKESQLADIYSFGALMYEVATGTSPTIIKSPGDSLAGFVPTEPAPPRARNRNCPKWLEEAILKCMAREPANRFQSFEHVEAYFYEMQKEGALAPDSIEERERPKRASRVARARGVAKKESSRLDHYYLGVEHIMLGILAEEEATVLSAIDDKVTVERLRSKILSQVPKGEGPWHWEGIIKTPRYRRVMKLARTIRREYSDERMLPQHILLAILLERNSLPTRVLEKLDVDIDAAVKKLREELGAKRPSILVTDPCAFATPFAHKLSCTAGGPYFTPLLGRANELKKAQDLLSEGKGIIIVGEPGVGKTTFARRLACAVADAAADADREYGSVYKLRAAALLANKDDAGEVIDNLIDLLNEVIEANSIIFIDDLPTLLEIEIKLPSGAFAQAIENGISSQGLLVAATATPESYAGRMAKNERLLELLEVIDLKEPSEEETLAILRETGKALEVEHTVTIAVDALEAALRASTVSSYSRALPAGAIELLVRACAFARLHSVRRAEEGSSIDVTTREIELIATEGLPVEDAM